ncbi:hypothetical protein [Rurimicrobium arvi]|uniref:Uncharacterized protein n=1 Tax=Rurimicrobium arvi TaxID=2049916 RepID=A0ABP8N1V8_9BACT
MNQQLENILFFKENLGMSLYPVTDLAGNLLHNVMALVGLRSQTELELCAQYIKGKITLFDKSRDGKYLVMKENAADLRRHELIPALQGHSARGILVELAS